MAQRRDRIRILLYTRNPKDLVARTKQCEGLGSNLGLDSRDSLHELTNITRFHFESVAIIQTYSTS